MADDLVLVRYDLGDEYEITPRGRAFAEANSLDVLEESAYDRAGGLVKPRRIRKRTGRPAKPHTSVSEEAATKQAAVTDPAPTEKEQNR